MKSSQTERVKNLLKHGVRDGQIETCCAECRLALRIIREEERRSALLLKEMPTVFSKNDRRKKRSSLVA